MRKDKNSLESQIARMKELSGMGRITESDNSILHKVVGVDSQTYGIIKENSSYFIKESKDGVNFEYIGGLRNKVDHKYNSYGKALKDLNCKMNELNESFSPKFDEIIDEVAQEVPAPSPEEEEAAVEEVPAENVTVDADVSAEAPAAEAPAEYSEPAPEAAPAEVAPEAAPEGEMAPEEAPAPEGEVAPEEMPAAEDGLADDDSDLDDPEGEDPLEEINSLMGKVTAKIRATEMTPQSTKAILNTMIASLNLQEVDPEERLEIARRVKRGGGKKVDEMVDKTGEAIVPSSSNPTEIKKFTDKGIDVKLTDNQEDLKEGEDVVEPVEDKEVPMNESKTRNSTTILVEQIMDRIKKKH